MDECEKKYGTVKNISKTVEDIEKFCTLLKKNKVKDSQETFVKLPLTVQCLFLYYGWEILSNRTKYSDDSYKIAFYLFKLFRSKEMKERKIYEKYTRLKTVDDKYKKAAELHKSSPDESSKTKTSPTKTSPTKTSPSKPRVTSKKYNKEYQKYAEPDSELDPTYIYYTSLYSEKPLSPLAITWLTEHGVFEEKQRDDIVTKYKRLLEKNQLIKLK